MPWEKMSGGSRGRSGSPKISIRKTGSIGINASALDEFFDSDEVECADIWVNEEENKLGLRERDENDSYTYSMTNSNGSGVLNPTSILKRYGFLSEITTQYVPEIVDIEGDTVEEVEGDTEIVVIDIDDPVATYGSPKSEEDDEAEVDDEDDGADEEGSSE